jgi:hypothetical protein
VNGTGSGSCPMVGFAISGVEKLASVIGELVHVNLFNSCGYSNIRSDCIRRLLRHQC